MNVIYIKNIIYNKIKGDQLTRNGLTHIIQLSEIEKSINYIRACLKRIRCVSLYT